MLYYENRAKKKGYSLIIGVDEAGRGTLAGPVVAAAVKLKKTKFYNYIDDSKKLTALERELAFSEICEKAYVGVGIINESVIDIINIIGATRLAMERAVGSLIYSTKKKIINKNKVFVLIDGNLYLNLPFKFKSIIRGDSKSLSIACASIIAKVTRDRIMSIYGKVYPDYYFQEHKGYGTIEHYKAIRKYGACLIHRRSFAPLKHI